MPRIRLSLLLILPPLIFGFPGPEFFNISMVPECRGEILANNTSEMVYGINDALEVELLALTNQQRARQGLKVLILDNTLTQIAREHSYGMAHQGFISHYLPEGDLRTRLNRAGYLYEKARENVASASTVSIAQDLLISSPSHKNNILEPDVTQVGIGVVQCRYPFDKQLYITQIFAAPRRNFRWPVSRGFAIGELNEFGAKGKALSIEQDPLLANLALHSVMSLEVPVKREELQRLLANSADELVRKGRTDLSRLQVAVQLLRNPDNYEIAEQTVKSGAGKFGTAVRKVTDGHNQDAFLVLTLIGFSADNLLVQKMARIEQ